MYVEVHETLSHKAKSCFVMFVTAVLKRPKNKNFTNHEPTMKSQLRVASHAPNAIDKNNDNTLFLKMSFYPMSITSGKLE